MTERPLAALLGRGATYTGEMTFEGRVRVDGTYRGRIHTEDVLEVGEGGLVDGEIDAATLIVAGTVSGKVRARERVVVEATGTVRGELDASALEVHPGARFDATVKVG
ncbi:MAG: bactofilin family protein [Myxococcota bacterium]